MGSFRYERVQRKLFVKKCSDKETERIIAVASSVMPKGGCGEAVIMPRWDVMLLEMIINRRQYDIVR